MTSNLVFEGHIFKPPFMYQVIFFISFMAFLMNVLEIHLVRISLKEKLTIPLIFIFNLTLADIFMGVIASTVLSLLVYISNSKTNSELIFKILASCDIIGSRVCAIVAIFSIVAMTLDRVFCTMKPMKYRQINKKYALCSCVIVWVIAILTSISSFLLTVDNRPFWTYNNSTALFNSRLDHVTLYTKTRQQYDGFWKEINSHTEMSLTDFKRKFNDSSLNFDQSIVTIETYKHIRSSSFRGRSEEQGKFEYIVLPISIDLAVIVLVISYSIIWHKTRQITRNSLRNRSKQRNNKFLHLIIMTVTIFIVMWMPLSLYFTCYITGAIKVTPHQNAVYEDYLRVLPVLNSAINPFIYFKCTGVFKKSLRTFFKMLSGDTTYVVNYSTTDATTNHSIRSPGLALRVKTTGARLDKVDSAIIIINPQNSLEFDKKTG